ncbi:MAG TPA: tetratricopeptide repeat protein [Gemmatimonadaceae bacterium]
MLALGRKVGPALILVALSATAGAQQKACEIDEGTPNQVARAVLDLQLAQSASKPEDVAGKLKDAIKLLNEGDMKKNPVGRSFVLGKTLVMWLAQPGMTSGLTTRGAVGLTTEPTAPFDIIAGIDSAFSVVEASNADCASQTAAWRQQKGWVDLVNQSFELANSDKLDSAVTLAKRSLQLSKNAPYGFMVLAQSAAKHNQSKEAIDYYKQAIAAAKDTSQADARRQILLTLGNYTADLADAAPAADKAAMLAESKAAFDALAKDPGTKFADAARNGQARLAAARGDTAAIRGSYADQLANPNAFSYNSLMNAAVTAARADQNKDAIKLFEAARTMNPYHRDVLYNLARLYLLDSTYAKGIPVARQLIEVDPSNPDDYQLLAIAYASLQKSYSAKSKEYEAKARALGQRANASKSSAVQKAALDSAVKLNPLIKAYQDSTKSAVDSAIKYQTAMTALPAKVVFTEFTPTDAKTTLAGSVANQTDAAKSFTLKIEFIDKAGAVVATQNVAVGPVQPHQSTSFTTSATGAGIVAFRYGPIS